MVKNEEARQPNKARNNSDLSCHKKVLIEEVDENKAANGDFGSNLRRGLVSQSRKNRPAVHPCSTASDDIKMPHKMLDNKEVCSGRITMKPGANPRFAVGRLAASDGTRLLVYLPDYKPGAATRDPLIFYIDKVPHFSYDSSKYTTRLKLSVLVSSGRFRNTDIEQRLPDSRIS